MSEKWETYFSEIHCSLCHIVNHFIGNMLFFLLKCCWKFVRQQQKKKKKKADKSWVKHFLLKYILSWNYSALQTNMSIKHRRRRLIPREWIMDRSITSQTHTHTKATMCNILQTFSKWHFLLLYFIINSCTVLQTFYYYLYTI